MSVVRLLVIIKYSLRMKPMVAIAPLLSDRRNRGMSAKYDLVDWIGGFPYEVAAYETLEAYCAARGFSLIAANRCTSLGCNEMAFQRAGHGG